jgi:hypothetical protein
VRRTDEDVDVKAVLVGLSLLGIVMIVVAVITTH